MACYRISEMKTLHLNLSSLPCSSSSSTIVPLIFSISYLISCILLSWCSDRPHRRSGHYIWYQIRVSIGGNSWLPLGLEFINAAGQRSPLFRSLRNSNSPSLHLEKEATTAPNRQAAHTRQICAAMDEMEERIRKLFEEKLTSVVEKLEDFSVVKEQLTDLTNKISDQAGRLDQVQTKVDLAMTSQGTVQQEQQQMARALKGSALPNVGIFGP